MKTSRDTFKLAVEKAFGDSNMKINATTMQDASKLISSFNEDELKGGKADRKTLRDIAKRHTHPKGDFYTRQYYTDTMEKELEVQLKKGMKVEMEHTKDKDLAKEIAMDHLWEDPKYYQKLKKIETKEQIIVRPVKKSTMNKIIKKSSQTDKPIGKIFGMSKNETKENDSKVTAKAQFASDLQKDPDFQEFKKNAKYKKGGSEFTFGIPNVSNEDPYIKKKTKYGRPGKGKEETIEATGSGSSGAYVGPVFGGDNAFWEKSRSESPKLKEGFGENIDGIEKIETKEATTSGSVGGYQTPAMWAKSTSKKDWGPSRKTQYPNGSFVQVKKKCTKFPYCNQGDINALKLSKNESVSEAIKNVAIKTGIDESYIRAILELEYQKMDKRTK